MYKIVQQENGKYAVQNMVDGFILKSKESGNVISYPTIEEAEKLRAMLQHNVDMIIEASKFWFVKERVSAKEFIMRKIEI